MSDATVAVLGFQPFPAPELGYGQAVHHILRAVAGYTMRHGYPILICRPARPLARARPRWLRSDSQLSLRLPVVAELSEAELDELVEQAVVDAYGDDEQMVGFYTMINDNLALPFTTTVLGVEVNVEGVDVTDSGIVAICARGADRQAIPILDLPLPVPAPPGSEWIAAYRRWAGGQ